MTQPLVIPEQVLTTLQELSLEQRQLVFEFAEFLLQKPRNLATLQSPSNSSKAPRVFGLHAGKVQISDDFDAPCF